MAPLMILYDRKVRIQHLLSDPGVLTNGTCHTTFFGATQVHDGCGWLLRVTAGSGHWRKHVPLVEP